MEWFFDTTGTDVTLKPGLRDNDGAWHHTAVVWDKPNNLASFYRDGQLHQHGRRSAIGTLFSPPPV